MLIRKRSIFAALLLGATLVFFAASKTVAAPEKPQAVGAQHAGEPSETASHAPQEASHGGHGDHPEIDERLVPLPPSRDTIVSAVWVLIIFILMLVILYPLAWKKVLIGLKAREERIRNDIANAEKRRREAEATLQKYNEQLAGAEARIRDMLAKAQSDGEKLATTIRNQAQQEAEDARARAQRDIEASKNAAIREVYDQTATIATSIAEKILRRNLNVDDQRELVRQSLEQLQTIK